MMFVATGAIGAGLLASGIGFMAGFALEGITGIARLLDVAGVAVSRRCSAKAAKQEAVRVLAASKLNTVHSHISKALEDCEVSDDEYKLILDEVEEYRTTKEELRRRHVCTVSGVIDEKTNKSSAVAEMGDRGHNRYELKRGGLPLSRELGPRLVQCGLRRGLLSYQAASSSIRPFDMG